VPIISNNAVNKNRGALPYLPKVVLLEHQHTVPARLISSPPPTYTVPQLHAGPLTLSDLICVSDPLLPQCYQNTPLKKATD